MWNFHASDVDFIQVIISMLSVPHVAYTFCPDFCIQFFYYIMTLSLLRNRNRGSIGITFFGHRRSENDERGN